MTKRMSLLLALLVVTAACSTGVATTTTSTTIKVPPPPQPPATTSTTLQQATTSTTLESSGVPPGLQEAKDMMVMPKLLSGGLLEENGAFAEDTEGHNPIDGIDIFVFNYDNMIYLYLEGPANLMGEISLEADALDGNFGVVNDGGYVGQNGQDTPPWSQEGQVGKVQKAADSPPPDAGPNDRIGVVVPTEISTLDEFVRISFWLYRGLRDNKYDFAHFETLFEDVLENADAGVVVAAFFSGFLSSFMTEVQWLLITS